MSYIDKIKKDGVIYDIHDSRGSGSQESLYRHLFRVIEKEPEEGTPALFYTTVNHSSKPVTTLRELLNTIVISPVLNLSGGSTTSGIKYINAYNSAWGGEYIGILEDAEQGVITLFFRGSTPGAEVREIQYPFAVQQDDGSYAPIEAFDSSITEWLDFKDTVTEFQEDSSNSFPEEFNFD